ncbi:MAG TPA: hypothetical protein VFZ76_08615 [Anaerolineales bacterium]
MRAYLTPTGSAGVAAAGAAAGRALRHCAAVRVGEKHRDRAGGMLTLALLARNRGIRVFNRAQRVETSFAVQANVFVDGHIFILIP